MKKHFFLLALLVSVLWAALGADYNKCQNHYFNNGKIASAQCYDASNRWGKATAYNAHGVVIFEKELRNIGGHSTVQFSYYESGAVKRASWSSAPDGGIQWYSSVTDFDEDGKITNYTENNYNHSLIQPMRQPPVVKQPQHKNPSITMRCAEIWSSEYWFINTTPYTVTVDAVKAHNNTTTKMKRGTTAKGGAMILAQQFDDPAKTYHFSAHTAKGKARLIIIPSDRKPEQVSKEVRRYYFEVRRII